MQIKLIEVSPSASEYTSPTSISPTLTAFCAALELALPTSAYWTGNSAVDLATLSLAAAAKGTIVPVTPGSMTVDWNSAVPHEQDANDPTQWNEGSARSLRYTVSLPNPSNPAQTIEQYFFVAFEA